MPNPTYNYFTLEIKSEVKENLTMLVSDVSGRLIEQITGISSNSTLRLGNKYPTGVYIVEIRQGRERVTLRLIKAK